MLKLECKSVSETETLARNLSLFARPGMVIGLSGDLGAGKSTFARAFIKALGKGAAFEVPSPSFSLIQTYEETRLPVAHVDLYRLGAQAGMHELGLFDLAITHVVLVEWPVPMVESLSPDYLALELAGHGDHRELSLLPTGNWKFALDRNRQIETFLQSAGADITSRQFFEGDASSRRYEKVWVDGQIRILMDMPQRPDGPLVKDGKPYSAIAHLAENISSVIGINDALVAREYSAPDIFACDAKIGLALIEDLGNRVFGMMFHAGEDMTNPMQAAVEVLADMADRNWNSELPLRGGSTLELSPYDQEAQLIEIDLLPSWFIRHSRNQPAQPGLNAEFADLWRKVLPSSNAQPPVLVLRDYHSPNLLWLPERQGLHRVGLIDTQDAVLGHPAYDLASLLQDARVDVDFSFADQLFAYYVNLRHKHRNFEESNFLTAYAILGAQRATKILGIFARLNLRDGKPQYLKHMPRVARYLVRNLAYPALSEIRQWLLVEMPEIFELAKS